MSIRRQFLGLAAVFAGAAMTAMGAIGSAAAQEVTLRMHQFLPPQAHVPKNTLVPWAERIQEASGGRIEIQHFPSMQLGGKPPELIDQVIDGVADIVWTVSGYTPGRFPRTEVFELPFMMNNAEATSRAYWQLAEETMMDGDFADFKVLGLWVHGPGLIHSKDPVQKIDDLNGVKLRAPTRVTNKLFASLGATPVGMPVPAVPEALSKGVIDATVIPWEVTGALKVPELVTNHTTFPGASLYTTTFIFAMNKDRWEALPDDLKAIIDEHSGLEFSAMAGKQMQADDEPSRVAAVELGNNIIELSEDEIQAWRDASQATVDEWIAEMDDNGVGGTELFEKASALIAENAGQ